jgi:hypothetical protein
MEENNYIEKEDISLEELELIRTLSHLECIDEGIYPELNFTMDEDIDNIYE